MLRSTSLRVLRPERPARRRRRCSPATRSPTSSWPRGCEAVGLDPARLGGEMWGSRRRRPAGRALPRRRQPGARRRPDAEAVAALRRAGPPAGPPLRLDRRPARAVAPAVGDARAVLGAGPRGPRPDQPLMAIDGPPAGARPTRWCAGCGRTSSTSCCPACVAMFTEEVGVSPVGRRRRRRLPGRVAELVARRPGLRPHRGRPGGLQGRDRRGQRRGLPGAGRLGGARPARPRAVRGRHGRRRRRSPGATIAPVVSLYVNDFNDGAAGDLPQGRLRRGRRLHVGAVLATAPRIGRPTRRTPRYPRPTADSIPSPSEETCPCCCACRPCSCAPCARTRPTPRCRATGCSSAAGYIRRAAPGGYT